MNLDRSATGALSRRQLLAAGLVGVGGLAAARARAFAAPLLSSPARPPAPAVWPLPAHDLRATRHSIGAAGLRPRWRAHFPGGVPASAAIEGGVVYAASARGAVAALALKDGRQLWRRELGTATYGSGEGGRRLGFFSGVALSETAAIIAGESVHCLDRRTGRTRWSAPPLRTKGSDDYFWGAPTVVGDRVLVGSGSGGEAPSARGHLTAYRLADGAMLWSTPTVPEGANGGGVISPVSVDRNAGEVYLVTGAPYEAVRGPNPGTCSLIAMSLADGAILWHDQVFAGDRRGFDFNSAPVIVGRLLVATNKDGIFAWDRRTRRRAWHRRITDPLAGGAAVAGPTGGPEGGPIATDGRRVYVPSNDAVAEGSAVAALAPRRPGAVADATARPELRGTRARRGPTARRRRRRDASCPRGVERDDRRRSGARPAERRRPGDRRGAPGGRHRRGALRPRRFARLPALNGVKLRRGLT